MPAVLPAASPVIVRTPFATSPGPVDFVLVDIWIPMALPAVRRPDGPFRSVTLAAGGGLETSVKKGS